MTTNKSLTFEQVEKLFYLNKKFVVDNIGKVLGNINHEDAFKIYELVDACKDNFWKYAVDNSILEIIKMELEYGCSPNRCNGYALNISSKYFNIEMVELLLKWDVDVTIDNNYALRTASDNGHFEVVKLLLQHGANVHAGDDYALSWASGNGHLEVVKLLLQHKVNVHAIDDSALRWASKNGHFKVVKLLLQHKANVYARDDESLKRASAKGHSEVVKVLLQHYNINDNLDKILDMKLFDMIDKNVEFVDENHENGVKIKENGEMYSYKKGKKIKFENISKEDVIDIPVIKEDSYITKDGKNFVIKRKNNKVILLGIEDEKELNGYRKPNKEEIEKAKKFNIEYPDKKERSVHDKTFLWACQRKCMKLIKNLSNNEYNQEVLFEALVNCYSNNCVELFEYIIKNYNYDKEIIKDRLIEYVLDNEKDNSETFFNILYDYESKTVMQQFDDYCKTLSP